MGDVASEQEHLFREWMRRQLNKEGYRRYTDNAVIAYCYALKTTCNQLSANVQGNLFYVRTLTEFEYLYGMILTADNYEEVDRENGNGTFDVALKLYRVFLDGGMSAVAPEIEAPFYMKAIAQKSDYSEDRGREFNYSEVAMTPIQCIYYGAPGTGKSYKVNQIIEEAYPDKKEQDAHCKRMIFHPTYTYADFVGSIKPLMSLDHPLDYMYSAGPFTSLLKSAFLNPNEKYYLVIEEINRGNSPAIFGDLFQLLDRQADGKSRYAVQNVDISTYFSKDPGLKNLFYEGKVWLPANFNILATMNTADENIFVLDSAFKRRFTLEYVRIEFDHMPQQWKEEYDTFAGKSSLLRLFSGTPLADYAAKLEGEDKLNRNWPTFARLTNYIIDMLNRDANSKDRPELARIPENKKLGPFFVSDDEIKSRDTFINKVIFYLKQDVFTYSDHYMKESYEDIYLRYLEDGEDLFELLR